MNDFEPQDLSWIGEIGERFEQAWEKGERPRIEDFLSGVPESKQGDLLRYLLSIELERRRGLGERPRAEEYKQWFTKYQEVVGYAFHHGATLSPRSRANPQVTAVPNTISARGREGDWQLPGEIGRFQVRAWLGAGGFGNVYLAYDPQLDREVALKVPQAGTLDSPRRIERFLREAKAAAQLRHPHIVPIYDAGHDGHHYYIASAFIKGHTLADAIDESKVDLLQAAQIVRDLAEALAYAHELGIVHRDVKPANIMLDEKGQPHLMDFGLARRQESAEKIQPQLEELVSAPAHNTDAKLTQVGTIMGTAAYMAPEQAAGRTSAIQPASDQYSLGVVLYELLCGQTPFSGPLKIVLFNVVHTEPRAPRAVKTEVPLDLETICLKAMAKHPEDRYANCQEMADDLRRWLEGEPIQARRLGRIERVVRWCRREPKLAITGAVAAVCLIAVALVSTVSAVWMDASAQRERMAKDEALEHEARAVESQKAEASARERAESDSYFLGIALAERELKDNKVTRANELLDQCQPALRCWEWGYLRGLASLKAPHKSAPSRPIAYSTGGAYLAVAGKSGSVHLWRTPIPSDIHGPLCTIEKSGADITCLAFSQSGNELAAGDSNGGAWIWDIFSNRTSTIPGNGLPITRVAFSLDGGHLATVSKGGILRIVERNTGKEKARLPAHTERVNALVFSLPIRAFGESPLVCAIGQDKNGTSSIRVWNASNWKEIDIRMGITAGALIPENRIALAKDNETVLLMDAKGSKAEYVRVPGGTDGIVHSLFISRDGQRLVSADDSHVKVWDAISRKLVRCFQGTADFAVSPDGKYLAAAGKDDILWIWDLETGSGTRFNSQGVPLSPNPHGLDGAHETPMFRDQVNPVNAVAFSSDGKWLVSGGRVFDRSKPGLVGGELKVWDIDTGKEAFELQDQPTAEVRCVAFSSDGARLTSVSEDGAAVVWDMNKRCRTNTCDTRIKRLKCVALSLDSRYLAAAGEDGNVRVWELETGQELGATHTTHASVTCLAFSPDSRWLVCAGQDKVLTIMDAANKRELRTMRVPFNKVTCLAFSADCARLALASEDGLLEIWDLAADGRKVVSSGFVTGVQSIAFSPDGKRLVSAGLDRAVRIWDLTTDQRQQIISLNGEAGFNHAVFSRDGQHLAAGNGNGLKIWSAVSAVRPQEVQETPAAPLEMLPEDVTDKGLPKPPPSRAEADKYIPGDAGYVFTLNVRQILESEFVKQNGLDLLKLIPVDGKNVLRALGEELGVDPFADVVRVVVALPNIGAADKSLIIVQGKFEIAKFHDHAKELAQKLDVELKISNHRGHEIWEIRSAKMPSATFYLALVNDRLLVAALSKDTIDDALERTGRNEKGGPASTELQILRAKDDPKAGLSVIALGDALMTGPVLNDFFKKIRNIEGKIFVGRDLKVVVTVVPKNPGDTPEVAETIEGAIAFANNAGLPFDQSKGLLLLVKLLGFVKVQPEGEVVTLRAELSQEKIIKSLLVNLHSLPRPKRRSDAEKAQALEQAKQLSSRLFGNNSVRDAVGDASTAGRLREAVNLCRQIIQESPGTASAKEAQQLISQMASNGLNTAKQLAKAGHKDRADFCYGQIIAICPDTDAAKAAEKSLGKQQRQRNLLFRELYRRGLW